ncbi:TrbG/VirB9 family P-type conjugative transfer protein [Aestuariispira insulae]|uniref:Conjugative transfer protein CagX n=1 Tax=Aestuariispira insulae TaxID=1461337 RepID=A0A3D9H598_9PROT|nr:TrbG/VirB9 family P-type conjugative transfer protein [Aestuariispira insulae]RED44116.1 conjugative transfer protein CagX [Aestuariispira insulae]
MSRCLFQTASKIALTLVAFGYISVANAQMNAPLPPAFPKQQQRAGTQPVNGDPSARTYPVNKQRGQTANPAAPQPVNQAQPNNQQAQKVDIEALLLMLRNRVSKQYGPLTNPTPGVNVQEIWTTSNPEDGYLEFTDPVGFNMKAIAQAGMPFFVTLPEGHEALQVIGGTKAIKTNYCKENGKENYNCISVNAEIPGHNVLISIRTDHDAVYRLYVRSESFLSKNPPTTWVRIKTAQTTSLSPNTKALTEGEMGDVPAEMERPLKPILPSDAPMWTRKYDFDPTEMNRITDVSGDAEIAPYEVFTVGKFTFLEWKNPDVQRWPTVFEVVNGIDQPVRIRKTKDHRYLIVETVGPLTLKRGGKIVCIRPNKA